jgi:hypothetical protein
MHGVKASTVEVQLETPFDEEVVGISSRVFVQGEIDATTPDLLKSLITRHRLDQRRVIVYLDSPGGNLLSGIKIGKLIRDAGMSTSVGRRRSDGTPRGDVGPGECLSACVYALVGGTFRYADNDDVIGVHRFSREGATPSDLEIAQVISAAITNHFKEMGVDAKLFEMAAVTAKDEITIVPIPQAERLGVVNNGRLQATWGLTNQGGRVYLRGEQMTDSGNGKLLLLCSKGRVKVIAIYQVGNFIDKMTFGGRYSIRIDGNFIDVQLDEPHGVHNKSVNASFWLTPEIATRLLQAKRLGFAFYALNPDLFAGFEIDSTEAHAQIRDYMTFCRTQA